jgi:hypothetical protein
MNHDEGAAQDRAARYVTDRMGADEEREFEAHLLECSQCVADVEEQLALRDGLRTVAPTVAPMRGQESSRWSAQRWLAAAAVLLAAVSIGLTLALTRTTAALHAARAASQEQHQQAETARSAMATLQRRVDDLEGQSKPASDRRDAVLPTAIFALVAVRSGDNPGAPRNDAARPINQLMIPANVRSVVLTVDLPPVAGASGEYALTLSQRGGPEVWSGAGFRTPPSDTLAVAVDRALLPDGTYTLAVSARPSAGSPLIPVGQFPFEITSR